jgi:hypothetical protein
LAGVGAGRLARAVALGHARHLPAEVVSETGTTRPGGWHHPGMAEALKESFGRDVPERISLAQHATRTHHLGVHAAELVVNGATYGLGAFTVRS